MEVLNSLEKDLKFTTECHLDFPTGTLPTLDYQVWPTTIQGASGDPEDRIHQFYYKFFEKPMAAKFCILEPSASSWEAKKATLAQETARRLENTSTETSAETRTEILEQFCTKMERSGYSMQQRRTIITDGVIGHIRKMQSREQRHRKGAETETQRRRKKLTGRASWFKMRKKKENIQSAAGKRHSSRETGNRTENT